MWFWLLGFLAVLELKGGFWALHLEDFRVLSSQTNVSDIFDRLGISANINCKVVKLGSSRILNRQPNGGIAGCHTLSHEHFFKVYLPCF